MARNKKEGNVTPEEKLKQALVPEGEQPFVLPENWLWVKFDYLATELADGPFGSNLKQEHYTNKHEVRIIQLSNIGEDGWREENTKYTTFEHAKTISRSIVDAGNIVVAKMMPAGRAIIVPNKEKMYILSSDAIKVVPQDFINARFLLYGINCTFFRNQVQSNTQGITRSRTSIGKLKKYAFPLPPLVEQKRIVELIVCLIAMLDAAKELVQSALDSFETRKAAILHKAFTGEITAIWREEHEVGNDSWDTKCLKDVCTLITDGTHQTPSYSDEGYIFLSSKNVTSGRIDWDDIKYIPEELHNQLYSRLSPRVNDILLAKNGTTGIAAIVDRECVFDIYVSLALLRPNRKIILPRYLLYSINNPFTKEKFINELTGIGLQNLHLRDIRATEITIPSIPEQQEIVRILDNLVEKEQQAKELTDILDKIDLMKKAILGRAFRGELGTNDPTEESVIELLKEVLSKQ